MKACVVDASVAVKWVVEGACSEQAARLLDGRALHAPAHWMAESVNALWGYTLRGEMTGAQATTAAQALLRAPIVTTPLHGMMEAALRLSLSHSVTVYDAFYLVLARQLRMPFVTDDHALMRKLASHEDFATNMVGVAELG